jgi:hypothetical protein
MATSLPIPRDSQAKRLHILRQSAEVIAAGSFAGVSLRAISPATGSGDT